MQTIRHEAVAYLETKARLTEKCEEHHKEYLRVSAMLQRYWLDHFTVSEMLVLTFIVGRTLAFRKKAEAVAFRHFLEGVKQGEGRACAGCGLTENTVRKTIKQLQEREIILIHTFHRGKVESLWRIYELNLSVLASLSEQSMPRNLRKTVAGDPLPTGGTHPSQPLGGYNYKKNNKGTSTSVEVSADLLPTPKKGRKAPVANCSETPQQVIARIKAEAERKREARLQRASTTPAKRWQSSEVQALLDKARERAQEAGYTTPRVIVTARPLPTLHKRMLAAEVADPLAFFTWTLQNWGTIASANRRSKARQAKETRTTTEAMSMAPNFNDLSYRFPYIVAFYNDREQTSVEERRQVQQQEQKVAQVRQSSQAALELRKKLAREQDLKREEERRAESEAVTRRMRRRPKVRTDDDEDERPVFVEPVWSGK